MMRHLMDCARVCKVCMHRTNRMTNLFYPVNRYQIIINYFITSLRHSGILCEDKYSEWNAILCWLILIEYKIFDLHICFSHPQSAISIWICHNHTQIQHRVNFWFYPWITINFMLYHRNVNIKANRFRMVHISMFWRSMVHQFRVLF